MRPSFCYKRSCGIRLHSSMVHHQTLKGLKMSYRKLFTSQEIDVLAWIGKNNFIQLDSNNSPMLSIHRRELVARGSVFGKAFQATLLDLLEQFENEDPHSWKSPFLVFCAARSIAEGEKILQLTADACDSLSEKPFEIRMADYAQPFDTMIISLPQDYEELKESLCQDYFPAFMTLHHDRAKRFLSITVPLSGGHQTIAGAYTNETFREENFGYSNELKNLIGAVAAKQAFLMIRIAMNAMQAMTRKDNWRELPKTPLEEKARKQLKIESRSTDKAIRRRSAIRNGTSTRFFELHQTVKAFGDPVHVNYVATWSEIEGTPKKPHFRKGHHRMLRVGPGRTQRRKIFIEPTMINRDKFVGDLKDTSTTYVSKKLPTQ
jgi:hypothetical protein